MLATTLRILIVNCEGSVLDHVCVRRRLAAKKNQSWHRWRGPDATGIAPLGNSPVEWSEDRDLRWKVAIPGHGKSTRSSGMTACF